MIIVMEPGAPRQLVDDVMTAVGEQGFQAHPIFGVAQTVIGVVGDRTPEVIEYFERLPGVLRVVPIMQPYKLAARSETHTRTVVRVRDVEFGGSELPVIAGPCSVESEEQIMATARAVKASGARMLRGGAFKPRTSPYSFRGLKEEGLKLLSAAREETGLPVATEIMDVRQVEMCANYADMLQIGARNMQNFDLLEEVGRAGRPVLLKRGLAATVEELLMSAEYIMAQGNPNVVVCERGIRTFETSTRNTLDLSAVPVLHRETHLPVLVDPSHGTGHWHLVEPLARAAVAVGADGLMIEVHPNPKAAISDGAQSLNFANFAQLMAGLAPLLDVVREYDIGHRTAEAG